MAPRAHESLLERLRQATARARLSLATLRERFLPACESVAAGDTCISRRELCEVFELDLGIRLTRAEETELMAKFGDQRRGLVDARALLEAAGLWMEGSDSELQQHVLAPERRPIAAELEPPPSTEDLAAIVEEQSTDLLPVLMPSDHDEAHATSAPSSAPSPVPAPREPSPAPAPAAPALTAAPVVRAPTAAAPALAP